MGRDRIIITQSAEETFELGRQYGATLKPNAVICFFGDLAAGKTTFIKGLAHGAAEVDPSLVNSPTFVYLNIYKGTKTLFHFDLYRLKDADEFLSMGFDEMFFSDGICCIEWSERITPILPEDYLTVEIQHLGEDRRKILL